MVTMPHLTKNNIKTVVPEKNSLIKDFDENKNVFLQAISNLDESGVQLVKDIITPFLSPVQTAKDLKSLGSSVINLIVPGEQGNEQLAREVGKFFKDRYGGLENIKKGAIITKSDYGHIFHTDCINEWVVQMECNM